MNERAPIYEGLAHYICEVDNKSVDEISSEIEIAYELRGKGESNG
jgi:shikimate kinase